jgi:hypothetical protein
MAVFIFTHSTSIVKSLAAAALLTACIAGSVGAQTLTAEEEEFCRTRSSDESQCRQATAQTLTKDEEDLCRTMSDVILCRQATKYSNIMIARTEANLARGALTPWDLCSLTLSGRLKQPTDAEGVTPACRAWFATTPEEQARRAAARAARLGPKETPLCVGNCR